MSVLNPYQSPEPIDDPPLDRLPPGSHLPYASRWLRLGGSMLDLLIVGVPSNAVGYFLGYYDYPSPQEVSPQQWSLMILTGNTLFLLINARFIYTRGQTVGKIICHTMVVTTDGRRASGNRYLFARLLPISALSWICLAICLAAGIPLLDSLPGLADALAIFRPERTCLHDSIAGTRVVDLRGYRG